MGGGKLLLPNHLAIFNGAIFEEQRFYIPTKINASIPEIAQQVATLLHENMRLISQKFKKPAISLTGGCDSKTTLACAYGIEDKFGMFSYISSDSEQVDAEAAAKICEAIHHSHTIYQIPNEDSAYKDIECTRAILQWNAGNLCQVNRNDVRKRRFFEDTTDFDVEVKSWVSEIGRAYYSKRFNGMTNFGKPTARKCTTMYKVFFHDRQLVKDTDKIFQEYLDKYFVQDADNPIEWQDQFFWEFRVASWNGLVITSEHRYSFDITIPYNNRRILELLLSVPLKDRINDTVYKEIRKIMNPVIDSTGISVQNVKHTNNRAKLEKLYYQIHSKLPF